MIRGPAVAGLFYPSRPEALAALVDELLAAAGRRPDPAVAALVAPHAGYTYSAAVAAAAFALVPPVRQALLLGPSHFVPLRGLAVSSAEAWETPLGRVPVSGELRRRALAAGAALDDRPHARDHALEVELPFLQRACPEGLEVLPVAVGRAGPAEVAELIAAVGALAVCSTDLSHYHPRRLAEELDRRTAKAVLARDPARVAEDAACGVYALRGLVEHARRAGLAGELLALRTSADAGGDPASVVGYGAFAFRRAA